MEDFAVSREGSDFPMFVYTDRLEVRECLSVKKIGDRFEATVDSTCDTAVFEGENLYVAFETGKTPLLPYIGLPSATILETPINPRMGKALAFMHGKTQVSFAIGGSIGIRPATIEQYDYAFALAGRQIPSGIEDLATLSARVIGAKSMECTPKQLMQRLREHVVKKLAAQWRAQNDFKFERLENLFEEAERTGYFYTGKDFMAVSPEDMRKIRDKHRMELSHSIDRGFQHPGKDQLDALVEQLLLDHSLEKLDMAEVKPTKTKGRL